MPLDQSAAYILGLFQKRDSFFLKGAASSYSGASLWGQILCTPTLENTLLGVGAHKRGGGYKILPRGASKYTPPPLSEKGLLAEMGGRGGRI